MSAASAAAAAAAATGGSLRAAAAAAAAAEAAEATAAAAAEAAATAAGASAVAAAREFGVAATGRAITGAGSASAAAARVLVRRHLLLQSLPHCVRASNDCDACHSNDGSDSVRMKAVAKVSQAASAGVVAALTSGCETAEDGDLRRRRAKAMAPFAAATTLTTLATPAAQRRPLVPAAPPRAPLPALTAQSALLWQRARAERDRDADGPWVALAALQSAAALTAAINANTATSASDATTVTAGVGAAAAGRGLVTMSAGPMLGAATDAAVSTLGYTRNRGIALPRVACTAMTAKTQGSATSTAIATGDASAAQCSETCVSDPEAMFWDCDMMSSETVSSALTLNPHIRHCGSSAVSEKTSRVATTCAVGGASSGGPRPLVRWPGQSPDCDCPAAAEAAAAASANGLPPTGDGDDEDGVGSGSGSGRGPSAAGDEGEEQGAAKGYGMVMACEVAALRFPLPHHLCDINGANQPQQQGDRGVVVVLSVATESGHVLLFNLTPPRRQLLTVATDAPIAASTTDAGSNCLDAIKSGDASRATSGDDAVLVAKESGLGAALRRQRALEQSQAASRDGQSQAASATGSTLVSQRAVQLQPAVLAVPQKPIETSTCSESPESAQAARSEENFTVFPVVTVGLPRVVTVAATSPQSIAVTADGPIFAVVSSDTSIDATISANPDSNAAFRVNAGISALQKRGTLSSALAAAVNNNTTTNNNSAASANEIETENNDAMAREASLLLPQLVWRGRLAKGPLTSLSSSVSPLDSTQNHNSYGGHKSAARRESLPTVTQTPLSWLGLTLYAAGAGKRVTRLDFEVASEPVFVTTPASHTASASPIAPVVVPVTDSLTANIAAITSLSALSNPSPVQPTPVPNASVGVTGRFESSLVQLGLTRAVATLLPRPGVAELTVTPVRTVTTNNNSSSSSSSNNNSSSSSVKASTSAAASAIRWRDQDVVAGAGWDKRVYLIKGRHYRRSRRSLAVPPRFSTATAADSASAGSGRTGVNAEFSEFYRSLCIPPFGAIGPAAAAPAIARASADAGDTERGPLVPPIAIACCLRAEEALGLDKPFAAPRCLVAPPRPPQSGLSAAPEDDNAAAAQTQWLREVDAVRSAVVTGIALPQARLLNRFLQHYDGGDRTSIDTEQPQSSSDWAALKEAAATVFGVALAFSSDETDGSALPSISNDNPDGEGDSDVNATSQPSSALALYQSQAASAAAYQWALGERGTVADDGVSGLAGVLREHTAGVAAVRFRKHRRVGAVVREGAAERAVVAVAADGSAGACDADSGSRAVTAGSGRLVTVGGRTVTVGDGTASATTGAGAGAVQLEREAGDEVDWSRGGYLATGGRDGVISIWQPYG